MKKKMVVKYSDVILALKVNCLLTEAGLYVPDSQQAVDHEILGLIWGNVAPEKYKMDTKTSDLILHLQSFFQNVKATGSSFVQHLTPMIHSEWEKVKRPPLHVRFGFRPTRNSDDVFQSFEKDGRFSYRK